MTLDLKTTIAGIKLDNPLFNASGPKCTTLQQLEDLGESAAGAVISKSCTLEPRQGNPEPRYRDFKGGSINSMGLPNLGYRAYLEMFPKLKKYHKPILASVSGLSLTDNLTIIKEFNQTEIEAMEINLSCPNVPGKPQIAYDFDDTQEYLKEIGQVIKKPWGVKLPPYFDFAHFEQVAKILNDSSISFVTCINSLGNGLVIDPAKEEVVIKPKNGFGGIGGPCIKPIGLSNVRKFRELLKPEIDVIGVGGIEKGLDIFEYVLAGASAVQIGTVLEQEGPKVFTRLLDELKNILTKKGYNSLADFKNKLKTL
jgi:dihydroorotate dehydrogenase (fumarate)